MRIVGHGEGVIEITRLCDREHRSEDLFLEYAGLGIYIGDHGGRDEVAISGARLPPASNRPSPLPISMYSRMVFFAPALITGPIVVAGSSGEPTVIFAVARLQLFEERVVDLFMHDGARTRRTFLSLIAEGRSRHAFHRGVEIAIGIHDDRVLAAHLGDDALDPDLACLRAWRRVR